MNNPSSLPLSLAIFDHVSAFPLFVCLPEEGFRFVYANDALLRQLACPADALMSLRYPQDAGFPLPGIAGHWAGLASANDTLSPALAIRTAAGHTVSVASSLHRITHDGQVFLLGHLYHPNPCSPVIQQLEETRASAEQALAVRNRFLAHMSHELRTPLSGIIGLSQLARDTESLTLAQDYFEQIRHSGEHLLTTLGDILDFCQIETGTIVLNPVAFNPGVLLKDLLQEVKSPALAKNLKLHTHIEPELPGYLIGDALRLRQVLFNLVENAVKFTQQGEVGIKMEKVASEKDDHIWIRITVSDTGPGILPENRPRLFKAFEQLDASDSRHHQGVGLGLALAWRLARLMGGTGIALDSTPGQGSTFSLELPFDAAASSVLKQHHIQVMEELPLRGLTILIAEDNDINLRIARAMMEKAGACVAVAKNGALAVEMLRDDSSGTYDVVLMDIQMPVMDGYTATRLIREELKRTQIPIIATTAHAMSSDRQACLEAGMNAHLSKPINQQLLISTILHALPRLPDVLMDVSANLDTHPLQLLTLISMNRIFKESIPNLSNALTCLGNDERLYCELARLFVLQHGDDLKQLEACLGQADRVQAEMLEHTLKELSNTLGLLPLHEAMVKLHFKPRSCPEEWRSRELDLAHAEMQATLKALRQLLLGLPT